MPAAFWVTRLQVGVCIDRRLTRKSAMIPVPSMPAAFDSKLLSLTVQVRHARCFRTYPNLNLNERSLQIYANYCVLDRVQSGMSRSLPAVEATVRSKILYITANDAAEIDG